MDKHGLGVDVVVVVVLKRIFIKIEQSVKVTYVDVVDDVELKFDELCNDF